MCFSAKLLPLAIHCWFLSKVSVQYCEKTYCSANVIQKVNLEIDTPLQNDKSKRQTLQQETITSTK